jgi:hypothetical protein
MLEMGDRTRAELHRAHPKDDGEVRSAFDELDRDEAVVTMTADQFERWMATGEGGPCLGSSGSARGT